MSYKLHSSLTGTDLHTIPSQFKKSIETVLMSFETSEQTVTKIYFPMAVTINKIRGIVMLAIAATDAGTITGANSTGASANGALSATASATINTALTAVSPTTNNTVAADGYYQLTSAKTTDGGKVLVTLEYTIT